MLVKEQGICGESSLHSQMVDTAFNTTQRFCFAEH